MTDPKSFADALISAAVEASTPKIKTTMHEILRAGGPDLLIAVSEHLGGHKPWIMSHVHLHGGGAGDGADGGTITIGDPRPRS